MQRYLLSIELKSISINEIKSYLQTKLSHSTIHVIQKTCLLIESTCLIAHINGVLQEIEKLDNYVLVLIASGLQEEGAPCKMYLYPSLPKINDTING